MPVRPSGDTMPIFTFLASATLFFSEKFIAPGWNAMIWFDERSVVMNACAVNVLSS